MAASSAAGNRVATRAELSPSASVTTYRKALPRRGEIYTGCPMPPFETIEELPAITEPRRAPLPPAVARFEIRYSRFLDPKGNAVRPLPDFARDRAELVGLYRAMVLARRFDT